MKSFLSLLLGVSIVVGLAFHPQKGLAKNGPLEQPGSHSNPHHNQHHSNDDLDRPEGDLL